MGNTQCGSCLARQTEQVAEILLGKNERNQHMAQNSSGSIKGIREEIDDYSKRNSDGVITQNNNVYNQNAQNNSNYNYRGGKGQDLKQKNLSNEYRLNNNNLNNRKDINQNKNNFK